MKEEYRLLDDIISDNYKTVFKICYYLLENREMALDAAQETFKRVYEKVDIKRSPEDMIKYIKSTAYNISRNYLAERRRRAMDTEPMERFENKTDKFQLGPLDILIKDEHRETLRSALGQLDGKYKDVLILHYYLDLPYEKISKRLNVSVDNIGVRIHRAKKKLHKLLYSKMSESHRGGTYEVV